jgi:hypothetical protein
MADLLTYPEYIKPQPKKILWCYGTDDDTDNIEQFKKIIETSKYPIRFHKGIPDISNIGVDDNVFIVLDDLMQEAGKSKQISKLFSLGRHHKNISVALILQNFYHQAASMREISLNSHYLVLFKNPRDGTQINYLARQIFPDCPKYLTDAYRQASARPHGYIIIDVTQQTCQNFRILTNIFPDQICYFFVPKDNFNFLK